MGMVVRTNTMALNSYNALGKNNSTVSKNLEKLSSGFRINRAADDASGLAISEKMKAQIKALDTASANAQDGVSLIQTAEGYMGEVHDMLNRIVELAEKSANGTYETKDISVGGAGAEVFGDAETDRQALQDEVNQLTAEIDRIATTANFNNLKLMDGTLTEKATYDGTETKIEDAYVFSNVEGAKKDNRAITSGEKATADTFGYTANGEKVTIKKDEVATQTLYKKAAFVKLGGDGNGIDLGDGGVKTVYTAAANAKTQELIDGNNRILNYVNGNGYTLLSEAPADLDANSAAPATLKANGGLAGGLKLQIGETSTKSDKLTVNVMNFKTDSLFSDVTAFKNADGDSAVNALTQHNDVSKNEDGLTINISNQDSASMAAEAVREVINTVSTQRATLGAMQNRLEYTMNNLNTASENISNANSRIRDTDMAKTMMAYTQGNVLTQAAQAMLAQANQQPSNVLQLLQ